MFSEHWICPYHSGVVPGGSGTYENGTGEVLDQPEWFLDYRWTSRQLSRSSVILDCNPDHPETYPDSSERSENSPERSWKYSRSVRNVPKPSRKVTEWSRMFPEGPGSFRKFSDSTTHCTHPLALGASHLGWPKLARRWGRHGGGNPTRSRIAILLGVGLPGRKDS